MADMGYMRNVMRDMESADDWSTIRIKTKLKQTIENDILPKNRLGVPLYNSVADFVHTACLAEIEKVKKKEADK